VQQAVREHVVHVEVREPVPRLRYALRAPLEAVGGILVEPGDTRAARDVVIWSLPTESTVAALQLADPTTRVLALVHDPAPWLVNELLGAGARAVLDRTSSPETIARAAISVARNYVVLPADCSGTSITALRRPLDGDEMRWMRALADGTRVPALAAQEGCGEREMYRRLRSIYRKLEAPNRDAALHVLRRRVRLD
jgi:DNA-binding NarL/FixJ family response regulator